MTAAVIAAASHATTPTSISSSVTAAAIVTTAARPNAAATPIIIACLPTSESFSLNSTLARRNSCRIRSAVCCDRSEKSSPSERSMRGTSMVLLRLIAGFAEVARVRRRAGARGHGVDLAEAVAVCAYCAAIRRRLQEAGDAEADQERAADEERRTPARERMHVVEHVGNAALADGVGKTFQLVARGVDVRREGFVFVAELVAGAAEHIRDAEEAVGGAILLLIHTGRHALLDASEHAVRRGGAVSSAVGR